jgi:hypothetical protein
LSVCAAFDPDFEAFFLKLELREFRAFHQVDDMFDLF